MSNYLTNSWPNLKSNSIILNLPSFNHYPENLKRQGCLLSHKQHQGTRVKSKFSFDLTLDSQNNSADGQAASEFQPHNQHSDSPSITGLFDKQCPELKYDEASHTPSNIWARFPGWVNPSGEPEFIASAITSGASPSRGAARTHYFPRCTGIIPPTNSSDAARLTSSVRITCAAGV